MNIILYLCYYCLYGVSGFSFLPFEPGAGQALLIKTEPGIKSVNLRALKRSKNMLKPSTGTEAGITGNSIKALFNGLKLPEKPDLFAETLRRFSVTYPNIGSSFPFDRYLEMAEWLRKQLFAGKDEATGY